MLSWITKAAMVLSFLVFCYFDVGDWISPFLINEPILADMFGLPEDTIFPFSFVIIGLIASIVGLMAMAAAYFAIWRILDGGPTQDFRLLASRLRLLGGALIVMWLAIYIRVLPMTTYAEEGFEPASAVFVSLDIISLDLVFLIIAVSILAISGTLERAWTAEEETKHFL